MKAKRPLVKIKVLWYAHDPVKRQNLMVSLEKYHFKTHADDLLALFKNMYFSGLTYCWILSWESHRSQVSLLHFDVGTQPRPSDEPVT